MKFVDHSIAWAKGEQFEGLCIVIAGVVALIIAAIIWKYGTTINAKSLVWPSFAIGLLFVVLGGYMVHSNGLRQKDFKAAYDEVPQQFIAAEKERVEDFQFMYPTSLAISAGCFLVTLLAFVWSKNPNFHAIGIALSVLGLSLIVIDYFSKERAALYYEQITSYLK